MPTLGVRRDAVWLRVPLEVPRTDSGRWLLDIDYPSLDQVEVHVVSDGRAVAARHAGRRNSPSARARCRRWSHLLPLVLEAGQDHELLLRVQTTSSMVLPLRFMRPEAFSEREAGIQMVQGLMTGIGLCLLLYSLAHWLSLRDASFLYYGLSVAGISLFFYSYYGLGPQHLWGGNAWFSANMAPFSVLLALVGGLLFLERALLVSDISRRMAVAMKAVAALAALSAAAFALGLIDYRGAHLVSTVLGPPRRSCSACRRPTCVRGGAMPPPSTCCWGWGLYAVGILTMAALLRGVIDFNVWTNHAFQAGAMLEMVMWLRVLGRAHAGDAPLRRACRGASARPCARLPTPTRSPACPTGVACSWSWTPRCPTPARNGCSRCTCWTWTVSRR